MASISAALRRVKEDQGAVLDREHVRAACVQARHKFRDRTLDPFLTIVSMLVQVMHGNTAIGHVVRLMHSAFNESAFCQARGRLPLEVLLVLLGQMASAVRGVLDDAATPGLWHGRRTLLIDGSGFSMPDTAELTAHFGLGPGTTPGCGFPGGHLLGIFDAATGLLLDVATAAGRVSDLALAPTTRAWLRRGDILIGDRGFCSFVHLALLQGLEVDGVFRLHQTRKDHRAVRRKHRRRNCNGTYLVESVLVRRLTRDDQIVEWIKPSMLAVGLTRPQQRLLPRFMQVRVIRFRTRRRGWRTKAIVLATTLLDPVQYPAAEIAELYLGRWAIELNLRHLKKTMGRAAASPARPRRYRRSGISLPCPAAPL